MIKVLAQKRGDFIEVVGQDAGRVAGTLEMVLMKRDDKPMTCWPDYMHETCASILASNNIEVTFS